ncbi:uncharacterized protein LOC107364654 [Tetranychus urticae]|uniref:CRAL-TRIO domain-containing protein n=1 Tax=Tetranychus urticae TaxID=32264 RepID=T1KI53_TETUR|nr:uncharacterized protein LOC107364654 [Tetranychus urticae]XP_015787570.1 uncharacterized protein LOC107364654 [Tetranychus urticae]XP_015787571.1 uncharacterized protein LOC107364654 [Tetranychus urticae]
MKQRKTISEEISDLRMWFDEEYGDEPGICDQIDYKRVMNNDWLVKRFILSNENGPVKGLECLKQYLAWRKANRVNYFNQLVIPREIYNLAPVFQYLPDYRDNNVLYIRGNILMKLTDLSDIVRTLLIHNIDRIDGSSERVASWGLVVDVTGSDYSQLNSSWLQEANTIISNYYPLGMRYMLIYGASRMLRMFGKMIGFGGLQFVDSKGILDFIPASNLPDFIGTGVFSKTNYHRIPKEAKPLKEMALNIDEAKINSILETIKPLLIDEKQCVIVDEY